MSSNTVKTAIKTATVTESVSTSVKELGICSTCKHLSRCLFVKAAHQQIWDCEEFDDREGGSAAGAARVMRPSAKPASTGEGMSAGLCEDCAERSDCATRKPGVAVTDCADYK